LLLKIEQNGGLLDILSHYIFARNACQGRSDWGVWGSKTPQLHVKLRQKSGKIQVKILTFSGKICVLK
jgi:hypothetical protein